MPPSQSAGHSPHLLLNSVLLSHDGFIIGKTVNTWKKQAAKGYRGLASSSRPLNQGQEQPGEQPVIWTRASHILFHHLSSRQSRPPQGLLFSHLTRRAEAVTPRCVLPLAPLTPASYTLPAAQECSGAGGQGPLGKEEEEADPGLDELPVSLHLLDHALPPPAFLCTLFTYFYC